MEEMGGGGGTLLRGSFTSRRNRNRRMGRRQGVGRAGGQSELEMRSLESGARHS